MPMKTLPGSVYKLCKEKRDDIEIFSVKLTDSALRTLETISHKQVRYTLLEWCNYSLVKSN